MVVLMKRLNKVRLTHHMPVKFVQLVVDVLNTTPALSIRQIHSMNIFQ